MSLDPVWYYNPDKYKCEFTGKKGDVYNYVISEKIDDSSWDIKCLKSVKSDANIFSKDPSTKVSASIYRKDRSHCSKGYNGYPTGIKDSAARLDCNDQYYEWLFKQKAILHAEENALLKAYESVEGYTLYVWPLIPCPHCASLIINSGISRVVAPDKRTTNGGSDLSLTLELFEEAGVEIKFLEI